MSTDMENDIMIAEDTPLLGSSMAEHNLKANEDYGKSRKRPQYAGGLAACMAGMAVGVTMGWSSTAQDRIEYSSCQNSSYACPDFYVSDEAFSWISAILAIGAMCGAILSGLCVDIVGRKRLIIYLAPMLAAGWGVITWAQSVWMYNVGRFLTGIVSGAYCLTAPMFISEISENTIRGGLGACFQLLLTVGILLAYVLDYAVTSSFFAINLVFLFTPVITGLAILPLPETPRFYLLKQNRSEARKSLLFYRGDEYHVDKELDEVEAALNYEKELKIPFLTAVRSRAAIRALVLSEIAMIFQQMQGTNAVIFYASSIFSGAGVLINSKLCSIFLGLFQSGATLLSTFLIDRAGRKVLLLISGTCMGIGSFALALYMYLDAENKLNGVNISWLPIIAMLVFIVMFSVGYGPIPWVYMSEVFSPQMKGPGMSIVTVTNWMCAFIVTKFYQDVSNALQTYGTFFLFSGISALGCVLVFTFFLETKNKTLEQVQQELAGRKFSKSIGGTLPS